MPAELRVIFPLEISLVSGVGGQAGTGLGVPESSSTSTILWGSQHRFCHPRLSPYFPSSLLDPSLLFPDPKTQMSWVTLFCPHNCQALSLQQPQQPPQGLTHSDSQIFFFHGGDVPQGTAGFMNPQVH